MLISVAFFILNEPAYAEIVITRRDYLIVVIMYTVVRPWYSITWELVGLYVIHSTCWNTA